MERGEHSKRGKMTKKRWEKVGDKKAEKTHSSCINISSVRQEIV